MDEGKRPGGLTALAVLNFVFAGFNLLINVLGTIGLLIALSLVSAEGAEDAQAQEGESQATKTEACSSEEPERQEEAPKDVKEAMAKAWRESGIGIWVLYVSLALYVCIVTLQITSGVGYLKQSRLWGRWIGTAYACVSIGTTVFGLSMQPKDMPGGGLTLCLLAFDLYPLLTLILLNTTFKEDLVR